MKCSCSERTCYRVLLFFGVVFALLQILILFCARSVTTEPDGSFFSLFVVSCLCLVRVCFNFVSMKCLFFCSPCCAQLGNHQDSPVSLLASQIALDQELQLMNRFLSREEGSREECTLRHRHQQQRTDRLPFLRLH